MLNKAVVKSVKVLSPTVKGFVMKMASPSLVFKAGQWVDITLSHVDGLTGYSMVSSPRLFEENEGTFELAIKNSDHPITSWMYSQCSEGMEVGAEFGGKFFYDPPTQCAISPCNLLLIAGGVGINPLISILRHFDDIYFRRNSMATSSPKAVLLYSSSTQAELLFKSDIEEMVVSNSNITCKFFVTRETSTSHQHTESTLQSRRLSETDIQEAVRKLLSAAPLDLFPECFVCGPPPMIQSTTKSLLALGVPEASVHSESWWH